jgi:ribosomal protein L22
MEYTRINRWLLCAHLNRMRESQSQRFCKCIKKVRKTVKPIRGSPEQAATAICVKSVLWSRGRTLKKFTCRGKPRVQTQRRSRSR